MHWERMSSTALWEPAVSALSTPQVHLEELCRLWDFLLELLQKRGAHLLRVLRLQRFLQECADILEWVADKVSTLAPEFTDW